MITLTLFNGLGNTKVPFSNYFAMILPKYSKIEG